MDPPSDNTTPGPPSTRTIRTPFGLPTRVSTDTFVNTLLPPLPVGLDLEKFINSVKRFKRSDKQMVTRSGRLRGYDKTTPSQLTPDRAFTHLHTCAKRPVKALPAFKPRFTLVHHDKSGSREDNELPDAYFCPTGETHTVSDIHWTSIAVSAAYQQENTAANADEVRCLPQQSVPANQSSPC